MKNLNLTREIFAECWDCQKQFKGKGKASVVERDFANFMRKHELRGEHTVTVRIGARKSNP